MNTIKLKKARNKYYDDGNTIRNCPNCNQELIEEKNTILLEVKSEKDEGQFMTNVPISRICKQCPTVVFNKLELEKAARLGIQKSKKVEYFVIGIIDLSESSKDKNENISYKKNKPVIAKNKTKRNDRCPCGSGKKYKKCCIND